MITIIILCYTVYYIEPNWNYFIDWSWPYSTFGYIEMNCCNSNCDELEIDCEDCGDEDLECMEYMVDDLKIEFEKDNYDNEKEPIK